MLQVVKGSMSVVVRNMDAEALGCDHIYGFNKQCSFGEVIEPICAQFSSSIKER